MMDVKDVQCSSHTSLARAMVKTLYDKPWILFLFDKISTREEGIRVTRDIVEISLVFMKKLKALL